MHDDTVMAEMIPFTITRFKDNTLFAQDTRVAAEIPVTFEVNGREIATLMCTPSHLQAFACGFLVTSGFIKSADDIISFPWMKPDGGPRLKSGIWWILICWDSGCIPRAAAKE